MEPENSIIESSPRRQYNWMSPRVVIIIVIVSSVVWILAVNDFKLPETNRKSFLSEQSIGAIFLDTVRTGAEINESWSRLVFFGSWPSENGAYSMNGSVAVEDFFLHNNARLFNHCSMCNGTEISYVDSSYILTVRHLGSDDDLSWAKKINYRMADGSADLLLLKSREISTAVQPSFGVPLIGREVVLIGYKILPQGEGLVRYQITGEVFNYRDQAERLLKTKLSGKDGLSSSVNVQYDSRFESPEYCLRVPNEFLRQIPGLSGSGIWLLDDNRQATLLVAQLSSGAIFKSKDLNDSIISVISFSSFHPEDFAAAISSHSREVNFWDKLRAKVKKIF